MIKSIFSMISREIKRYYFSYQNIFLIIGFYLSLILIFPISLSPSSKILFDFSSSIIWVCLVLTSLSFLNNVFEEDLRIGWLDQVIISDFPLEIIVIIKAISHWISIILPMIFLIPFLLVILNISISLVYKISMILIIGSMALSLLGVMTSSLVLGTKNTNALSFLIILPLCVPILIFGISATNSVINLEDTNSHFYLLCMSLSLILIFSPIASSHALKIALENN